MPSCSSQTPTARALGTLFLVALASRAAFVLLEPATRLVADERVWVTIGRQVASPEVLFSPLRYTQIFHPPLYAYLVGGLERLTGTLEAVKWVQVVLGALLAPLVMQIGTRAFSSRVGLLAGGITALYPELVWYAAHFWSEVVFLTLLWGGVERLTAAEAEDATAPAAVAGVLCGLAALVRETALVAAPLGALWLALGRLRGARRALVFLGACVLVVLPWTLRNWRATGAFVPVATRATFNLWLGNTTEPWDEVYREYHGTPGGPVAQSRRALAEAARCIWDRQPMWMIQKLAHEVPAFFGINDHVVVHVQRGAYDLPRAARWLVLAATALPFLAVVTLALPGFAGAYRERYGSLLVGFLVFYLGLHVVAFGSTRFRLPVLPVLFLLAGRTLDLGMAASWRALGPSARAATVVLGAGLALAIGANARQTLRHPAFWPRQEGEWSLLERLALSRSPPLECNAGAPFLRPLPWGTLRGTACYRSQERPSRTRSDMVTVCAWCQKYMGSKEPLHNPGVSHGICSACVERQTLADTPVLVVSPSRAGTVPFLSTLLRGAPDVAIVVDRRNGERRHDEGAAHGNGNGNGNGHTRTAGMERRSGDRRREIALYLV